MALTKSISGEISSNPADAINKAKEKVAFIQNKINENKALYKMYQQQFADLRERAKELGISDLNTIKTTILQKQEELLRLEQEINAVIEEIESKLFRS